MCWPLVLLQLKASALSQLDITTNGVPILTSFRLKKTSCDTHSKNKILRRLISFSLLATNCPSLRRESNVLTKNKGMAAVSDEIPTAARSFRRCRDLEQIQHMTPTQGNCLLSICCSFLFSAALGLLFSLFTTTPFSYPSFALFSLCRAVR